MNRREVGKNYEDFACDYISANGLIIIKRNFRTRYGEIDIVAEDNKTIVFVEVKFRKTDKLGKAEEAVGIKKQSQIRRIAKQYLFANGLQEETAVRFDVIGITGSELKWLKDAF